ncbi:endopeptidase La [Enemella evansiae]|uniref:endopeptidase La n=1 Tax=Enemella evansiae TaxID=2016499 RepID=UPI000B9633F4|nr:endopeptidase La [Enemella evansiae]OYO09784.1 endopeptidase La [Enemella evansiae]
MSNQTSPVGGAGSNTTAPYPVLFLDDVVVLPGMVVPVELDNNAQATIDAARAAHPDDSPAQNTDRRRDSAIAQPLLVVPRIEGRTGAIGTIAEVTQVGRLPSGEPAAVIRGLHRARIGSGTVGPGAALWVQATELADDDAPSERARELAVEYKTVLMSILQGRGAWQILDAVQRMDSPAELLAAASYAPWLDSETKLRLLETLDLEDRLADLLQTAKDVLAEVEVTEKIREDVREGMEKTQREYLLRQQLAAIRKELGQLSGDQTEGGDDYRSRIEAADLPEAVREAALREADRLESSAESSPETGWIRTWLDTVLDLPWSTRTDDRTDITAARGVLDADHSGLDDVKDRIVEYLAVRARREQRGLQVVGGRGSGAVMALVGPPGVGKTSLGESVARALGRKFVRVALGGVRDEAEIRGHRRTYVGALPGRIVRAIKEAGSMNPVVLLDEIDKVGSDFRGDPAAALLEVLDPAQNHTFRDHYLELDLDLSDVLFLATANVAETIPEALLDRMELIRLDGYTEDEKVSIARDHLLARQLERAGLTAEDVTVEDAALHQLAANYTREAGVRQLERGIAKILRKVATKLATNEDAATPVVVGEDQVTEYLGRARFEPEAARPDGIPGVATGLAVTGAGGDVLYVEVATMPGKAGLTLTGQLGDVMKESAAIALGFLRANGERLGIDTAPLTDHTVHVHFPAGAVPKDGPSAGVTMTTALASLLTGREVRTEVGMTGEVSLTGRVLPIGGVKQKLLAAHRAGLTEVIIPKRNEPDLDDVPEAVREALTVHLAENVADVIDIALAPATAEQELAA